MIQCCIGPCAVLRIHNLVCIIGGHLDEQTSLLPLYDSIFCLFNPFLPNFRLENIPVARSESGILSRAEVNS